MFKPERSTMTPAAPSSRAIRWAIDHPWRVVGAWALVLLVAIALITTLLGSALNNDQSTTNDPESVVASDLVAEHLPDRAQVDEVLVVRSEQHQVDDSRFQAFLGELVEVGEEVGVAPVGPPGASAGGPDAAPDGGGPGAAALPRSADGHAVLMPLQYTAEDRVAAAEELLEAVADADGRSGFAVDVTGNYTLDADFNSLSERDLKEGELYVGLPVAMLVLLLVFGTVVGALLPLMVAVVAIICALALAALVGQAWPLSFFMVNMVSGMGLALGIDYSLFVLSRYREERVAGSERDAAIRATGATASRAVLFSGVTFVVALSGMLLVPTTIMRSLAAGAILVGITAVIAALTLLPAVLRLLGDRVDALPVPFIGRRALRAAPDSLGFWGGLVRRVMRRPVLWGGTVAAVMLAMALPLLGMETGASGISTLPDDLATRQGYDALQANFPDQTAEPARVVVHDPDGLDERAVERLTAALQGELRAADAGYGELQMTGSSTDGELVELTLPVGADALSVAAVERVRDLRRAHVPAALEALARDDRPQVLVTGETALQVDYFDVMARWLPIVLAFVLGLSFVVLLVVFRSVAVPAVALALNLLSVGATYGLLVLVFQKGWGADLLGLQQVDTTEAWVPLFLFSVLFGLSMDYHMFLMSRIRERWLATGDTAGSVAWAVGSTGRIITGAALIIVAVFVGFAVGDLVMFQQMGFGIAVALLLDATLVRGVLLPAAMALLGDRNWYLPRWLGRLPEVQVD